VVHHAADGREGLTATADADADALEAGRLLFARACEFVAGADNLDAIPDGTLPEIAFAGRSNVGKSSLVNALTGRKTLARTSNTPGRTQQINFFRLAERLMLVDLPGYGYARAPKHRVAAWTRLVNGYLQGRPGLRRVCLLIDARHGPKEIDHTVMRMLDKAAVGYQVILTKADKIKPQELADRIAASEAEVKTHVAAHPEILTTSAETGAGIAELRAELAALAA
jgi:GTP-binding protein